MLSRPLRSVPHLVIQTRGQSRNSVGGSNMHLLRYRAKHHQDLPHIVKFSGGRTSGMLLFTLLANKILDQDRGDVIIFNNTSSEHPETYRFARDCKDASTRYGIPFFWIEFQTYEDARNGEWTRLPTYRIVNERPRSSQNQDGFHWRGEVFEELLSWSGYVPNQFSRICTANMKLETTRMFLKDWLVGRESIPRLGHYGNRSRIDLDSMYRRHLRHRGGVPKSIFAKKKAFVLSRPYFRPEQRYIDYSSSWRPFENSKLAAKTSEKQTLFGKDGVEYIAFVGLRGDEQLRVRRVFARNSGPGASGYTGEHVYMPLADLGITRKNVNAFWDQQPWDLSLPQQGSLSNCVYCFLKGVSNLRNVRESMEKEKNDKVPGFGTLLGTPSDIAWWIKMEEKYGRDLVAEKRKIKSNLANTVIGFFGTETDFSYRLLSTADEPNLKKYSSTLLPCDCTE